MILGGSDLRLRGGDLRLGGGALGYEVATRTLLRDDAVTRCCER